MTLAVSAYQWYLTVHLLAVVLWVGGAAATQVYAFRATLDGDPDRVAGFAKDTEWLGFRVFMPSSLLILVFGFLLIGKGDWGYPFWVIFGLAVVAVSFLVGMLFLGPESGRIGKLIDAHGVEHPAVQARLRRIFLVSRVELAALLLVVVDMVIKPFS